MAGRAGQSGVSLVETLVALVLVGTVVMAVTVGFQLTTRVAGETNERQRAQVALNSFSESVRQLDYLACGNGGSYTEAYENDQASAGSGEGDDLLSRGYSLHVTSVQFWSPGYPDLDGATPTCTVDPGAQLLTLQVSLGDSTVTGEVVKRNPRATPPNPTTSGPPVALFTTDPSPAAGGIPLDIAFDARQSQAPNGVIVSYLWNFGDGSSGSGSTVSHNYAAKGVYTVWLTVTDNNGLSATASATVTATSPLPGPPSGPPNFAKVGSGVEWVMHGIFPVLETYGEFTWNSVAATPAVDGYRIRMVPKVGCIAGTYSSEFSGSATSGRVQAFGLCLGTRYQAFIQAHNSYGWGPEYRIEFDL